MSRISRILQKTVGPVLAEMGLIVRLITPKNKVEELIKKLHPYKTQHELIRVGPNGDGGYLIPNDIENISACFSPGVDKISEFEKWCFEKGMKIYLADKSVDKVNLDIPEEDYTFIKKYVGCTNNDDFITLDKWVLDYITESDDAAYCCKWI